MSFLRLGLIGTRASGLARMQAVARRADAEVVATSGPGPVRGVMHFEKAAGLLLRADLDAVIYAGPVEATAQTVSAALGRGLHVLSARPPGLGVKDVITIRAAEARSPGTALQFSFPLHYHGSVATAKSLIAGGLMGRLIALRGLYATIEAPGQAGCSGALFDKGMQMLDLMQYFAGPFTEVKSFIGQSVWGEPGFDDDAFALLRTHSGIVAQLHASATWQRETFRLELGFEHGYVWLDGLAGGDDGLSPEVLITGRAPRDAEGCPRANPEEEITRFTAANALDLELADFLHAVRGRGPVRYGTSQQAFDAMNIVQRIYAEDRSWRQPSSKDDTAAAAE